MFPEPEEILLYVFVVALVGNIALMGKNNNSVFTHVARTLLIVHHQAIPEGGLAEGVEVPEALPGPEDEGLAFLGAPLPDTIARGIANGMLQSLSCNQSINTHQAGANLFPPHSNT